jgi:ATP-dependent exoDNAse (exonuclease V) beta subunit
MTTNYITNESINELFKTKIIKASAGTGKTYELAGRYIGLLARPDISVDKILATTFTVKSASEIRERIYTRLAGAVLNEQAALTLAQELKFNIQSQTTSDIHNLQSFFNDILQKLIHSQNHINILTLDSFFMKIVSCFNFELDLPLSLEIADASWTGKLPRKIFNNLCRNIRRNNLQELATILNGTRSKNLLKFVKFQDSNPIYNFNKIDISILHEIYRETLGKADGVDAQVSTSQIAPAWNWLKVNGLPNEVAKIDNYIVGKFAELQNMLPELETEKTHAKLISSIEKDIAEFQEAADKNVEKIQERKCYQESLKQLLNPSYTPTFFNKNIPNKIIEIYSDIIKQLAHKERIILQNYLHAWHELLKLYDTEYQNQIQISKKFNFSDTKHALRTANFWTKLTPIYYRLDSQIQHIMLDEFQDTSSIELGILDPIIAEVASKSNATNNSFFCVGDVKQTIYFWRGGDHRTFDATIEHHNLIDNTETREKSYRCSPIIIELINQVFDNICVNNSVLQEHQEYINQHDKWEKQFKLHSASENHARLQGMIHFVTCHSQNSKDEQSILKDIVKQVTTLLAQHNQTDAPISIGILFRNNKNIQNLANLLAQAGIEGQISEEGNICLFYSLSVKLIMSVLRLAEFPNDSASAFHVFSSPALREHFQMEDWSTPNNLQTISWQIRTGIIQNGFGKTISEIVKLIEHEYPDEKLRLTQLTTLAFNADRDSNQTIESFIFLVEHGLVENPQQAQVRLMSIHKAKGLEFDVVFLPELDEEINSNKHLLNIANKDDIFALDANGELQITVPDKVFIGRDKELFKLSVNSDIHKVIANYKTLVLYEALCLLYVAITRAKHGLYLYTTQKIAANSKSANSKTEDKKTNLTFANILKSALQEWQDKNQSFRISEEQTSTTKLIKWIWGIEDWQTEKELVAQSTKNCLIDLQSEKTATQCEKINSSTIKLESNTGIRTKNLELISPSQTVIKGGFSAKNITTERSKQNAVICDVVNATAYGSIIHLFFERLEWLENFNYTPADLLSLAHIKGFGELEDTTRNKKLVEAVIDDFFKYINSDIGLKYFSSASRLQENGFKNAKIYNELPIVYWNKSKNELVSGRIDRCVIYFNTTLSQPGLVEILDYKTDVVSSLEEQVKKKKFYQPQLNCYQEAIYKLIKLDPETCPIKAEFLLINDLTKQN